MLQFSLFSFTWASRTMCYGLTCFFISHTLCSGDTHPDCVLGFVWYDLKRQCGSCFHCRLCRMDRCVGCVAIAARLEKLRDVRMLPKNKNTWNWSERSQNVNNTNKLYDKYRTYKVNGTSEGSVLLVSISLSHGSDDSDYVNQSTDYFRHPSVEGEVQSSIGTFHKM